MPTELPIVGQPLEFKTGRSNGVTIAKYDFAKTGHATANSRESYATPRHTGTAQTDHTAWFSLIAFHIKYEGGLINKGRFLVTLKITALETSNFACPLSK